VGDYRNDDMQVLEIENADAVTSHVASNPIGSGGRFAVARRISDHTIVENKLK